MALGGLGRPVKACGLGGRRAAAERRRTAGRSCCREELLIRISLARAGDLLGAGSGDRHERRPTTPGRHHLDSPAIKYLNL